MKKKTKKLELAKDTVRNLETVELKGVDGGMPPIPVTKGIDCN